MTDETTPGAAPARPGVAASPEWLDYLTALGEAARKAREELYATVKDAVELGAVTEAGAARAAGIDRMTVRKILGKR